MMKQTKAYKVENRKWYLIDLKDQVMGRAADKISALLRGKHKTTFTPHLDCGDGVIVINAAHLRLTGKKFTDKKYYRHSRYPGGLKTETAGYVHKKDQTELVKRAVYGMLPKTRLRKPMYARLKVYAEAEHDHEAQKPIPYSL